MSPSRVLAMLSAVATSLPDPCALAAAPGQVVADPAAYATLVEEYAHGDSDAALRGIVTWKPAALSEVVGKVMEASRAGTGARPQVMAVLSAFPCAVMMHTEAGLLLNWQDDAEGAAAQWWHAQRLAELFPANRDQGAFLRAWYHAFGLFHLSSYEVEKAAILLHRGSRRFPDDLSLSLALGQLYEVRGTFWKGRVPAVHPDLPPEARKELRIAEGIYGDVLKRDPLQGEARLRLGHCLSLVGSERGLLELQAVASSTDDARLRYLAHLFAGELHRRESRLPEARMEFARSIEAWPGGQAASLGLAEALHASGQRREAASAREAASVERGRPLPPDPFRSYYFGDRAEHKRLLEAVRAMVRDAPAH